MHPTRNFISNAIELFYGETNLILDSKSEDVLSEFLSTSQNIIIQSCLKRGTIVLQTGVENLNEKCLIFYKDSSVDVPHGDVITPVRDINVLTLSGNVAESLYHLLRQVYSPILATENDVYSIKLQKHLLDLEAVLKIVTYGKDDANVNVILSIEDELEYWKSIGNKKDITKKEKEAVTTFCDLFQDVSDEIRVIHSHNLPEVRDAAENIGGLLDDVWRFTTVPYSQHRMIHIFDIIGQVICSTLQKTLSSFDIWSLESEKIQYEVISKLSDSLKVIQTWTSACRSLTDTYWPNYALHSWNGKPYVPLFCLKFEGRLKEIYEIRTTHCQLSKLLSQSEKSELKTETLFLDFQYINIWMYNGPNASWDNAVSKFYASLHPAEAKIAEKLKPRLHNTSTRQMLYEFTRYRALIERPLVKRALNNELEVFVSSLLTMMKNIQNQLEADEIDTQMYLPMEMSPIVLQIQWAKQMEAKVKEIQNCAETYLKEFDQSSELIKLSTHLLKELKATYTQLYDEWCRDLQAQAKAGQLSLSSAEGVVRFNAASRLMEVVCGGGAARAAADARALAAARLPPPPAAAQLRPVDQQLYRARALHQVASFHNTLGERMIPSTRPMMLQAALELSSLVQNQKTVYWHDTEQLDLYTEQLKQAVLKLESQNSYLTSQHTAIRKIVEKLMDTELLAKQAEWKKGVKDIRDIIEKVESNGYKSTELWRSHWDWQLYKALECQYIKTLLSLHTHFPNVKVDLVLRGHTVRVQPPPEELRVQHYLQLRRLVALPAQFVGLQTNIKHNTSIFTDIVDKHSWLGNKAVSQLETALSTLENSCVSWTRRAALACVADLEELCVQHLNEPTDWENNFKACKAYGQAVAKMAFEDEKIDWISVGTTNLRRELEAQTRNLWACLMSSLHSSCRNDAAALEAFIANATLMLENKTLPKNAKELADISSKQQVLQDKMPEMETLVSGLKKKSSLVRTWGGEAAGRDALQRWARARELLAARAALFQHQAETVKAGLEGEWNNLNTSLEAWLSRWSHTKAKFEETRGVQYDEMTDRCRSVFEAKEQWDKFVSEKEELLKECEKFNMSIEIPPTWNEAEVLINECDSLWGIFKEYNEEFETISGQDWIVFQKKLHLLDEFTAKWSTRLEPYTVVTLFLKQELDRYSNLPTLLKYVRGGDFTERHWREVYSLLEMEYCKPDTLTLKHFLDAALNIKKHMKALQKISTRASSECAVRTALSELEIWFAGARVTIVYHTDKQRRQTPIIKDFKQILNKIEEQQWAVSSLDAAGAGAGAGGGWAATLRRAAALLRIAHHAQRR